VREVDALGGEMARCIDHTFLHTRWLNESRGPAVRALRAQYLAASDVRLDDKLLNQRLLSALLAQRAEILETPVRFYAISPAQVRRTSVADGLQALAKIVWWRIRPRSLRGAPGAAPVASSRAGETARTRL